MNLKDAFTLKVNLKNFYKYRWFIAYSIDLNVNVALQSSHIFFNFLQDYTHFQFPNLEIKLPEHDSEHKCEHSRDLCVLTACGCPSFMTFSDARM